MIDDYSTEKINGYFANDNKGTDNFYINQMECDHDTITLRLPVPVPHGYEPETGEFCERCNARLDHPYGLRHYLEKFKYQERKKKNGNIE